MSRLDRRWMFWTALGVVLLLSRLAHRTILWADEDYHLAVAAQLLHGKMLYRDIWYDKPPLAALLALVFGGSPGWPLRVAGAAVALAASALAFRVAKSMWSELEGYIAAALLAFFQIFYLPAAIMPFEPDTLLLVPHLAAVYFVLERRFVWAGAAAGVAFLLSPKGLVALGAAGIFAGGNWMLLMIGFAIPCALADIWLGATGALPAYAEQVWNWGYLYATNPGSDPQAQKGWLAVADWVGFHAALLLGAGWAWWSDKSWGDRRLRSVGWAVLTAASAALGGRFAPRYFDALLVALAIPAARGIALIRSSKLAVAAICVALAVPTVRFGPRYFMLARDDWQGAPHQWTDVAMDQESARAAKWLRENSKPADTLFVWGYRPNVVVYSGLAIASKFWDSQPVTGVPADRHLTDARPIDRRGALLNRGELVISRPSFIVDGLSAYNRDLDIRKYADLAPWLGAYCVGTVEGGITIYRRCSQ